MVQAKAVQRHVDVQGTHNHKIISRKVDDRDAESDSATAASTTSSSPIQRSNTLRTERLSLHERTQTPGKPGNARCATSSPLARSTIETTDEAPTNQMPDCGDADEQRRQWHDHRVAARRRRSRCADDQRSPGGRAASAADSPPAAPSAATPTRRLLHPGDTSGLRHTHADANGERKEAKSREDGEQWVGADRSGERPSSETIVASHAIGDRKIENSLSASNERTSSGKRRRRFAAQADVQVFTEHNKPEQAQEKSNRVHGRRLTGGQLAGGFAKDGLRQSDSGHPAEQHKRRQVETPCLVRRTRRQNARHRYRKISDAPAMPGSRCRACLRSPGTAARASSRHARDPRLFWQQTTSPLTMTANRSASRSTISRMCEVRKTETPRAARASNRSLMLRDEPGSMPSNGSSRKSTRGLCKRAIANAHFFRMPNDAFSTRVVRPWSRSRCRSN